MTVYTCDEKAGIRNAKKIQSELLEIMDRNEDLSVNFSAVRKIDLSVAQLMIAAQKESKKRNLSFHLTGLSPEVKRQFTLCGVLKTADKNSPEPI
jgi:anti-anti-sigma regulatory factor